MSTTTTAHELMKLWNEGRDEAAFAVVTDVEDGRRQSLDDNDFVQALAFDDGIIVACTEIHSDSLVLVGPFASVKEAKKALVESGILNPNLLEGEEEEEEEGGEE